MVKKDRANHIFALTICECLIFILLLLIVNFKGLQELPYPVDKDHSNLSVANGWSDL